MKIYHLSQRKHTKGLKTQKISSALASVAICVKINPFQWAEKVHGVQNGKYPNLLDTNTFIY